jgi:hypothetical protein
MSAPDYQSYRDDGKTIVLYQSSLVTIKAVEKWSSDKCQPGNLCIELYSTLTFKLGSPEETNPNGNGQRLPENFQKFFDCPYFFGLITPVFIFGHSTELAKDPTKEPYQ